MDVLARKTLQASILTSLEEFPVTALLGPRQCGKTTIARIVFAEFDGHYFDLEDPADSVGLISSPMNTLRPLKGLVIIDEIQRLPELFNVLRVLADQEDHDARYLILGSASPALIKNVSETLAGRISLIDMSGFNILEAGLNQWHKLWIRGSFPRSFLAKTMDESQRWRQNFIRTFLERDIPQLGITIPSTTIRRFWTMVAHYHGQLWNGAEFARSISTSEPTSRKYLDLLTDAYVIRQIQPWYENISKRQVRSPKVYIRDSGLLHSLLSLPGEQILSHPKLGFSWEGFVIEQTLSIINPSETYFWATHGGAELDLFIMHNGRRIGIEIKYADAPTSSKSMRIALNDLRLDLLYIIYPGQKAYALEEKIQVIPLSHLSAGILSA